MREPAQASVSDTRLTHLDAAGHARMVDVGQKPATERRALARAVVRVSAETAHAVLAGDAPKGDVLGVARIAGIQAAKRTSELIPLCHPLALSFVGVEASIDEAAGEIVLSARAHTTGPTGVEMEALTAASVAALTVYDMVKGIERGAEIASVALVEKSGGRSDEWRRDSDPDRQSAADGVARRPRTNTARASGSTSSRLTPKRGYLPGDDVGRDEMMDEQLRLREGDLT